MNRVLLTSVVALGLSAVAAQAAICSAMQAGGITPSTDCHVGQTFNGNSGNDSAATMNDESVFGLTGWAQIAKDNTVGDAAAPDEGDSTAFSLTGSLQSGTMTISQSVFDTYGSVAVVTKAGNANTGGWIAYLVGSTNLSYSSIFPTNNGVRDLSHISLYGTGTPSMSAVPLPAAGWMLVAAFGGLAAVKRRKKA